jgi:hypothetical protein
MGMSEEAFLRYMKSKATEQKRAPGPTKGQKPKVTRMMSPRQMRASQGSPNIFRASYVTPEQAKRTTVAGKVFKDFEPFVDEVKNATREVGPGDKYNRTNDYTMGKDTNNKKGDGR